MYALMQSCDAHSYKVVFDTIRDIMQAKFGDTDRLSSAVTWLFDYESAAIQAVMKVFQTAAGPPKVSISRQVSFKSVVFDAVL